MKGNPVDLWTRYETSIRARRRQALYISSDRSLTGEDLLQAAESLRSELEREGLAVGEVAALALPNGAAFLPAYVALAKQAATVVLLSPKYAASEIATVRSRANPKAYLATEAFFERSREVLGPIRRGTVSVLGEALELGIVERHEPSRDPLLANRPALVKYTSGSLGQPKGIVLTAANLLAEAENISAALGIVPGDRIRTTVPLFHSYGFDLGVLPCLLSGATLHAESTFIPRKMLRDLEDQTSIYLGTPSLYKFLLTASPSPRRLHPDLRWLVSCTAPLHPDVIEQARERFGLAVCQHYGSSETGGATLHPPAEVAARPASVGRAIPGVRLWVRGPDGAPVAAGVEGEVMVESAAVGLGYLAWPAGEPSPLETPTFRTGDIGVLDSGGFLEVTGRVDRMISIGGLKVSPAEVARVLESMPAVNEAAIIGVKDALGEDVIVAVVTLRHAATEDEILETCRRQLADYKVPRRIEIRDELPRADSGKVTLRPEDLAR